MVNIFGDRGGGREEGKGSKGERGSIGPAGKSGPPGAKGDDGKEGALGPKGSKGDQGVAGLKGSKGDQGVAGLKGDRGPPGAKGSPGTITDLCTWMPHTVLKNLQENEEVGCFFIADLKKDIKRVGSDITQWISRSQKHLNLTAERASKSLTELANERHALVFHNSRYINDDILLLANHPGTHGFICVTFYTTGGDHEQTILSNFQSSNDNNWHEISITNTEINIWGKEKGKIKCVTIHHTVLHKWTTLFVEQVTGANNQTQGRYIVNNDPKLMGTFTFDYYHSMYTGFSVGSRYDNTRFFQGEIASIEMYHARGNKQIPQVVKDLVIKNQLIESSDIEDEEESFLPPPSPVKKKNIIIQDQMVIVGSNDDDSDNDDNEPPVKRKKINQSESCLVIT